MNKARGFTLVELMLVVAIVGVLAALAVPSAQGQLQRQRVSDEVQKVASGLTDIRNYARTRLRCVEVVVSEKQIVATPYEGDIAAPLAPCADPGAALTDEQIVVSVAEVSLGTFAGPGLDGDLWFDRRAATFDGHDDELLVDPVTLAITAPIGGPFSIRVFPATGTVRVVR